MIEAVAAERVEILLVDDRPENILALEAVLLDPSYDLIKASSGDEALRYLLDHNPAVILMDVQMPGLDGYDTAAIIKKSERTREIPIIFVTAINKDERYVHQGYDHGAVDYIYKPYDAHILSAKVAVFAEMRRQRERVSRLVAVQEAATQALAESCDVKESISKVLKSLCTSLGWDLGAFWAFDRRSNMLACQIEWHASGDGLSELLVTKFEHQYFPGVGLPGKTWATRKAIWIPDCAKDGLFPMSQLAARAGLHTAVGLPIAVRDEVLGVIEVFSRKTLAKDAALLKIMGAIGSQVGQALSRTRAFELVRAEEARKAAILETALDCIISMDHEGRITEFNPSAEKVFARVRGDVIGELMSDIVLPLRDREAYQQGLARYLASGVGSVIGQRIEVTGMRADGTELPVELTVSRVDSIEPPQFTAFLRDISERKKNERNAQLLLEAGVTLSSSLDYHETLASLARLSVSRLADWCVIDLCMEENAEPRTIATAHRDESKNRCLEKFCSEHPPDWSASVAAPHAIRSGEAELYPVVSAELLGRLWKSPAQITAVRALGISSVMSVPLTARGKTLGSITFIASDPANPYREGDLNFARELAGRAALAIDNAWLYREATNAVGIRDEFFSIASHELKTPITSLKMQLEMTQRMINLEAGIVPPADRLAKMLTTSRRQVDRLTHLIEELLDVVKIRAGKLNLEMSEVQLSGLVQEVLESYSGVLAGVNCRLTSEIEPDVQGTWDRSRMEQIVVNLLGNVVKYAPGKPVHVKLSRVDGMARLEVRDSGPGIAIERQGKIFERFERAVSSRSISGLGLGLFIARQIVEAHHGTIRVESREGAGAVFIVELPLSYVEPLKTDVSDLSGARSDPLKSTSSRR